MQTFLPFPNFQKSAEVLDYRRLGKQRVEAKQILQILLNETNKNGWRNHPAVLMWKGFENELACYGKAICIEWIKRGYKDSLLPYFVERIQHDEYENPNFITENFIKSHQSNLIRKFPEYYEKFFPNVPNNLEYIWPTKKGDI